MLSLCSSRGMLKQMCVTSGHLVGLLACTCNGLRYAVWSLLAVEEDKRLPSFVSHHNKSFASPDWSRLEACKRIPMGTCSCVICNDLVPVTRWSLAKYLPYWIT